MAYFLDQELTDADQGQPEYQALTSFVKGSIGLSDAAERFTAPVRELVIAHGPDSEAISSHLLITWGAFISVVAELSPDEQGSAVEFIRAIQQLPESKDQGRVWSSLSQFGVAMREAWNFSPESTPQYAYRWINMNALAAQLTSTTPLPQCLDFSLYGIWALRPALEDGQKQKQNDSTVMAQPSDIVAHTAAMWIIYASETLWQMSDQGKEYQGRLACPGSAYKEKEWKGYSKERWEVWEKRFAEVSQGCQDGKVKAVLEDAREKINLVKQTKQ